MLGAGIHTALAIVGLIAVASLMLAFAWGAFALAGRADDVAAPPPSLAGSGCKRGSAAEESIARAHHGTGL